jgi:hypothetical protein
MKNSRAVSSKLFLVLLTISAAGIGSLSGAAPAEDIFGKYYEILVRLNIQNGVFPGYKRFSNQVPTKDQKRWCLWFRNNYITFNEKNEPVYSDSFHIQEAIKSKRAWFEHVGFTDGTSDVLEQLETFPGITKNQYDIFFEIIIQNRFTGGLKCRHPHLKIALERAEEIGIRTAQKQQTTQVDGYQANKQAFPPAAHNPELCMKPVVTYIHQANKQAFPSSISPSPERGWIDKLAGCFGCRVPDEDVAAERTAAEKK